MAGTRRSLAEWADIKAEAEESGWTRAEVALMLGCSLGTVDGSFGKVNKAIREHGHVRARKPASSVVEEDGTYVEPPAKVRAVRTRTSSAKHEQTMDAIRDQSLVLIGLMGTTSELAGKLLQRAMDRLDEEPPEVGERRSAWNAETRTYVKQALDASKVINTSPLLRMGGYMQVPTLAKPAPAPAGDKAVTARDVLNRLLTGDDVSDSVKLQAAREMLKQDGSGADEAKDQSAMEEWLASGDGTGWVGTEVAEAR